MKSAIKLTLCLLVGGLIVVGCNKSAAPKTPEEKNVLTAQVDETIQLMKEKDPKIDRFFTESYGYAIFPKVTKGAIWVGGAFGQGEVYEHGTKVGFSSLSQATLGFSFGGEYFREIIFFRDKEDLDRFKANEYTFSAQVTGVALTAGAAAKADYKQGMAVFVMADKGLMVDASLGGQKFVYRPLNVENTDTNK